MGRIRTIFVGLVLLMLLFLVGVVWAGSSPNYSVDWSVLSGGGAAVESSSGEVALNGTLGQTTIGSSAAIQGELGAGFWYGLGKGESTIYLPVVLNNY